MKKSKLLLLLTTLLCVGCTVTVAPKIDGTYGYTGKRKIVEVAPAYMIDFNKFSDHDKGLAITEMVNSAENMKGIERIYIIPDYTVLPTKEIEIEKNNKKVVIKESDKTLFDNETENDSLFFIEENHAIVLKDEYLYDVHIRLGKDDLRNAQLGGEGLGFLIRQYAKKDSPEFSDKNASYSNEYASYTESVEKEKAESVAKEKAESESIAKEKAESESIAKEKAESESRAEEARKKAEEERKKNFSPDNYTTIPYEDAMRNEKEWMFKKVKISGKVLQVQNGDDFVHYRVGTQDNGYEGVFLIEIQKSDLETRVLEDDWINVYGYYLNVSEYTTVRGDKREIPVIISEKITID